MFADVPIAGFLTYGGDPGRAWKVLVCPEKTTERLLFLASS
ncbi:MAG TPA: hypothetical protein VF395_12120 [Polyangiaceae bacterium]